MTQPKPDKRIETLRLCRGSKYFYGPSQTRRSVGDADGKPVTAENRYVLHFSKEEVPPVDAFWSLTVSAKLRVFIGIFANNADAVYRAFGQQNFGR